MHAFRAYYESNISKRQEKRSEKDRINCWNSLLMSLRLFPLLESLVAALFSINSFPLGVVLAVQLFLLVSLCGSLYCSELSFLAFSYCWKYFISSKGISLASLSSLSKLSNALHTLLFHNCWHFYLTLFSSLKLSHSSLKSHLRIWKISSIIYQRFRSEWLSMKVIETDGRVFESLQ